jgi:hypothetical protein
MYLVLGSEKLVLGDFVEVETYRVCRARTSLRSGLSGLHGLAQSGLLKPLWKT